MSQSTIESESALVSVIIPTMASTERSVQLKRAIASIRQSSEHFVRIITVVNGARFDPAVCDWLKAQADVQFEYVQKPSSPEAICRGLELVRTQFFSTLDDDDEYLPGATDLKLAALQAAPQADLLVSNFYEHKNGVDALMYDRLLAVPCAPLACLMRFPWLSSINAMYRRDSIDLAFFKDHHPYAEWTWLAFKLAMASKTVAVLDRPTARYYDTPLSLSKSGAYFRAYVPLLEKMLKASPPAEIVPLIRKKMSAAYHDASVAALRDGYRAEAWRAHWCSLVLKGGFRYLRYTRHLFK